MKIAVLIGDGMGDYPLPEWEGRTPLQAAAIPHIRRIAAAGSVRLVRTVPDGMAPGSDVANLSIMGFDPRRYYTGRAPIEAAGAGLALTADDIAFRCNLITTAGGVIRDHSAGHITTAEARPIVDALNAALGRDGLRFYPSAGYRHLLIWAHGPDQGLVTTPPHDVLEQPVAAHLPRGARAEELLRLMEASQSLLARHPINLARRQAGKREVTQIWLWGQGRRAALPSYRDAYGLDGGVISAVDLVRGIGRLAGLDAIVVPGATGFLDTHYVGKVRAALEVLAHKDFVFVHVEAPDECGHMGERDLKVRAIEAFDREVVGPIWRALQAGGQPYRLLIGTDHRTPLSVRNHTAEPVPFAVLDGPVADSAAERPFDETVDGGRCDTLAYEWLPTLLKQG